MIIGAIRLNPYLVFETIWEEVRAFTDRVREAAERALSFLPTTRMVVDISDRVIKILRGVSVTLEKSFKISLGALGKVIQATRLTSPIKLPFDLFEVVKECQRICEANLSWMLRTELFFSLLGKVGTAMSTILTFLRGVADVLVASFQGAAWLTALTWVAGAFSFVAVVKHGLCWIECEEEMGELDGVIRVANEGRDDAISAYFQRLFSKGDAELKRLFFLSDSQQVEGATKSIETLQNLRARLSRKIHGEQIGIAGRVAMMAGALLYLSPVPVLGAISSMIGGVIKLGRDVYLMQGFQDGLSGGVS